MSRQGGFEKNFPDPERQKDNSAHPEKIKNETSRFHPVESNAKLNRENHTEHKSPDAIEPKDAPSVKSEGNFGLRWQMQELGEILQRASGNLRNDLSQKLRDQTIEADAKDRPVETGTLDSSKKNQTQQNRKLERDYRLHVDHMNHMLRAKL